MSITNDFDSAPRGVKDIIDSNKKVDYRLEYKNGGLSIILTSADLYSDGPDDCLQMAIDILSANCENITILNNYVLVNYRDVGCFINPDMSINDARQSYNEAVPFIKAKNESKPSTVLTY